MVNKKTTLVTADGKWQLVYTPQRETSPGTTRLASFDLMKWCDRGDLGKTFVTVNGYACNYKPSRAFPLETKLNDVLKMLVTDYHAEQWFIHDLPKIRAARTQA